MCGRFATFIAPPELVRRFALPPELLGEPPLADLAPRYNAAPTQPLPVVREVGGARRCDALNWGLIPGWAKDKSIGNRLINARSETAADKPSYRVAFAARRCLVPASGFYEWDEPESGGAKRPYFFAFPPDDRSGDDPAPFGFAGLWERWEKGKTPVETFTLLTGEPYPAVAPVHSRSPLIVPPDLYDTWLDEDLTEKAAVNRLVREFRTRGGDGLEARAVSTAVNSPANEGRGLIAAG